MKKYILLLFSLFFVQMISAQNLLPQGNFTGQTTNGSGDINANGNPWQASHGTPSLANGNPYVWMWSKSHNQWGALGEGVFTNCQFLAGHTYVVCYNYLINTTNAAIDASSTLRFVAANNMSNVAGNLYPIPPNMPVQINMMNSQNLNGIPHNVWQTNSFLYTPNSNYSQVWVYPNVGPNINNADQLETSVDNIEIYDVTNGPQVLADGNDITQTLSYTWNICGADCSINNCMNLFVPCATNVTYNTSSLVLTDLDGNFCLPPNSSVTSFIANIQGFLGGQSFNINVNVNVTSSPQPISILANGEDITSNLTIDICDTLNTVQLETSGICDPKFEPSVNMLLTDDNGLFSVHPSNPYTEFDVYISGTNTCGEQVNYTVHVNFVSCDLCEHTYHIEILDLSDGCGACSNTDPCATNEWGTYLGVYMGVFDETGTLVSNNNVIWSMGINNIYYPGGSGTITADVFEGGYQDGVLCQHLEFNIDCDPCNFTVVETCNNDGTATLTLYNGSTIVPTGFLWTINGDFYSQNPVTTSLLDGEIKYEITGAYNECYINLDGYFSCCDLHVLMEQVYDPPSNSHTIFTLVNSNNQPIVANTVYNNITWTMNSVVVAENVNPYIDYVNFGGNLEVDYVSKTCVQHINFPFAWSTPPIGGGEGEGKGKSFRLEQNSEIILYPNPITDNSFNITIKNSEILDENLTAVIFDVQGKVVSSILLEKVENNQIDIHQLENGIYLLKVKNNFGEIIYSNKISILR